MHKKTPLPIRSVLFLPATKLDKWQPAIDSGADSICIDLEDSIGHDQKETARKELIIFLKEKKSFPIILSVRMNPINTLDGFRDFMVLIENNLIPGALMIPKIMEPCDTRIINSVLDELNSQCCIIVILETAEGLHRASKILEQKRCRAALFGGIDLAKQIGCRPTWNALVIHRANFVRAAAGKNVTLIDTPYLQLDDEEGLVREAEMSQELGFNAKGAIHPKQITSIHTVFTPTYEELQEAEAIIREFEKSGGQAIQYKGKVVEKPVVESAKQLLARARYFAKRVDD